MVALTAPRALVAATHAGAYTLVVIDKAGHRVREDAAASVARMRAAGCPNGNVTSAYRTSAEQKAELKRAANGLTPSAAALGTSWHEAALAIDWREPQRSWVRAHGAEHGWIFTLESEPWHGVYDPTSDQHTEDDMPTAQEVADAVWARTVNRVPGSPSTIFEDIIAGNTAAMDAASRTKPIQRAGDPNANSIGEVSLRQEVADAKTLLIEQRATIAALTELVKQLAVSQGIDEAAVVRAVKAALTQTTFKAETN